MGSLVSVEPYTQSRCPRHASQFYRESHSAIWPRMQRLAAVRVRPHPSNVLSVFCGGGLGGGWGEDIIMQKPFKSCRVCNKGRQARRRPQQQLQGHFITGFDDRKFVYRARAPAARLLDTCVERRSVRAPGEWGPIEWAAPRRRWTAEAAQRTAAAGQPTTEVQLPSPPPMATPRR